jgi:glucosamine--fructose-6-phosphate aminotransferase (isomerizing)
LLARPASGSAETRLTKDELRAYTRDLAALPDAVESVVGQALLVEDLAARLADCTTFFYLGRGYDWAVALEAALKLKEIRTFTPRRTRPAK